jgi:hypothetical protein
MSVGPHKCSLVWCSLKCGVPHNPTLHLEHFNFALVTLFIADQARHLVLFPSKSLCYALSQVCLVGWWMGLAFLVSWSDFEAPSPSVFLTPSPTSVWTVCVVILNHKMREWEHSRMVCCKCGIVAYLSNSGTSTNEVKFHHAISPPPLSPYVCCSPLTFWHPSFTF